MGMGPAVIRPLLDAFDGMPIHVRQLAEMFRKHGRAQQRNVTDIHDLDAADAPEALRAGWRTDTDWTPGGVVSWKGDAPDPSEYLDGDYITKHLARFEDGASRLYFSDSLHTYGPGQRDGTVFVFPTSELQRILEESGADAHHVANQLGMEPSWFHIDNDLGKPLRDFEVRHFAPDELDGLRLPTGNEAGANDHWIPGGFLPTGIPEAVFDVPSTATGVGGNLDADYNPGMWPGTAQSVELR